MPPDHPNANPENKPRWFHLIGIQSSKNHARDFKHGKLAVFVVAGIVFVTLFVLTVYTVVRVVLQQATH